MSCGVCVGPDIGEGEGEGEVEAEARAGTCIGKSKGESELGVSEGSHGSVA